MAKIEYGVKPDIFKITQTHDRNTICTKTSHHGGGATVERDKVICFQVVQVLLLSSQCGCVRNTAETVAKDERAAAEPHTLRHRCSDPGTDC